MRLFFWSKCRSQSSDDSANNLIYIWSNEPREAKIEIWCVRYMNELFMSFYQYTDTNWNTFLWDWICQRTNQTQTFSSAVETLNFQLVFFWKIFLFFLFVSSTETQPRMLRAALSRCSDL